MSKRNTPRTWPETREGDRCHDAKTGRKGTVQMWPGGPVVKWDDNGELFPILNIRGAIEEVVIDE